MTAVPYARRSIRFEEFRQIVRRHRPSDLLPTIARLATRLEGPPYDFDLIASMPPWGLATIARESILWGNEHRPQGVTDGDLREVLNGYSNLYEPPRSPSDNSAHSLLTRVAYDQFPYQESLFEELSRSHVLLIDGTREVETEVLSAEAWSGILGMPLPLAVGTTFFLSVAAEKNEGWFDPRWLDQPNFAEILEVWPRDAILRRAEQLSASVPEFKAAYAAVPKPGRGFERYAFNPLITRPFVRWPDGRFLAPQPRLILRTVTPGALYYDGIAALGAAFGRDLGHLTEWYVGQQLHTLPGAAVFPEVAYDKSRRRSIDWFLVLPSLVILLEVKSARFGLLDRAADPGFETRIGEVLQKAVTQLQRTSEAIDAGVPEFDHIPADRPRVGMVVTAEPYYLANTPMVRSLLPKADLPVLTASLRDLEHAVDLGASQIETQILAIVNDPERFTWQLGVALGGARPERHNPLLERAWDSYPWPLDDGPHGDNEATGDPPAKPGMQAASH